MNNLKRYDLQDKVSFYNGDFKQIFQDNRIKSPIGVYHYDGDHSFESQYDGIRLAEPFLARKAIVIVDDWRFAADSQSFAKEATERAISESSRNWQLLYDLPARYNGDHGLWWNGVAVYATNA
jgi:hypothetical protein